MEIFRLLGLTFIQNEQASKSIGATAKKCEWLGSKLGKIFGTVGMAGLKAGS